MRSKDKGGIVAALMTVALLGWASGPAAAAVRIEGRVLAGGGGVAGSAVTLWAASADAPARLAEVSTDADGKFVVSVEQTPDGAILYLVAAGGTPAASKQAGNNSELAFLSVLGSQPPAKAIVNEMTTVASVWTHAQFLDGTDDQRPRARPAHRGRQRAQLRRSRDRRVGRCHPGPAQQRPDADDGQFRHAGRPARRLRHTGDAGCVQRASSQRRHRRTGGAPTNTLKAAESIARYPWYQPGQALRAARVSSIRSRRARTCARFRSCRT